VFRKCCRFALTLFLFATGISQSGAQEVKTPIRQLLKDTVDHEVATHVDMRDIYHSIQQKYKKKPPRNKKSGSLALIPTLGYNPSIGFAFGADVSGTKYFGDPENTTLSIFDAFATVSTNELALVQLTHNIYTKGNKWNIQGIYNIGKTVMLDHGLGTGSKTPEVPVRYKFMRLTEYVYRSLLPNFYAGAGFTFNYYGDIDEEMEDSEGIKTYNYLYSIKNHYPDHSYYANGLLLNLQYNTRDQPYRPYKGLYVDLILRANQKWLGSEKNSVQLKTELRKYWSLSQKNPEQVLALWLWGSYLVNGSVPYLELPGTGSDMNQRMGRAYTISRFKGPSFFYNEMEYRFPITRNKLLSGVAFFNVETASNQTGVKLFNYWEPGAGAGLRILFDKHTRSNLSIDYGVGNYGAKGVFVGLNEVF
jgi:outer membrane protein assembly factor BamA